MCRSSTLWAGVALVAGSLLGWLAASGRLHPALSAGTPREAAPPAAEAPADPPPSTAAGGGGKADGKPNILVIFGDDIGWSNISAYNLGLMGYKTPNIDKIGKDGAIFTDYYTQQSCTAGRAEIGRAHV